MLISHPSEANVGAKPLVEHLYNVGCSAANRVRDMQLDLTVVSKHELERLAFLTGIFHDFGKASTFFQEYIRGGDKRKADRYTRHSFVSAVAGYFVVRNELESELLAYAAFQAIKRHHGNLESFELPGERQLKPELSTARIQLKNIMDHHQGEIESFYSQHIEDVEVFGRIDWDELPVEAEDWDDLADDYLGDDREKRVEFFFIVNLLFSLLVDSDKKDAARLDTDYYKGNLEEFFSDVFAYLDRCRKQEPEKFAEDIPINKLRNEFLGEIATNKNISASNHFYTITAPTGIGKTFGCLAFARRLMEQLQRPNARVIYCLPYTSIIDQNFDEFEKVIAYNKGRDYRERPGRYLLKHHYLAARIVQNRVSKEEYCYKDYMDDTLLVESWESAFIVTTFVQFFHTVIGYRNRFLKKFHNIVNSIVILDEVQNIDPDYYLLLREVLDILGRRFNIYFLLVTATQPEILAMEKSKPLAVVCSSRYMEHPVFNRICLRIQEKPQTLTQFQEDFADQFSGENCLLVMNTKKSAIGFYRYLRENRNDYRLYCLTTNLVPRDRRDKIREIRAALNKGERIIVISTQLVEAGVDLSFKYVYRDFGPLDSIIQVAGRCNRHGEYGPTGGTMTLVRLQNPDHNDKEFHSYIYKPIIAQYVRQSLTVDQYESNAFQQLAETYFRQFDFRMESMKLLRAIYDLNYDSETGSQTPVSQFKLIKEYDDETLYILTTSEAQEKMGQLQTHLGKLVESELTREERGNILLMIERLKTELREYRISLRDNDLEAYQDTNILEDTGMGTHRFISYENQENYAYDEEVGFLREPKAEISGAVHF
ncbi:MAG: CRISPR-associated helicase Cas3' [Candidatus Aminicenantes bacterium]|nr:CRISPR-associated helicase Cas3' [Candidatus Aminicenantes bacterium]NIM77359.1 CRISPR-associated helicase Cas3' [Candidatus Aminicenantes bacterium]NIN16657.1 CRISPR-associated helicase Cas3' [Candidatus Aminicenantes bacterium]NIN40515.1 CRISPR-associated helicase Cas3' [Candidatus Aminicenantes bacterium]NIN83335.1 CRISPR-associated helicase Cas3' [Candidatus Aminicenantes bacterium]